MNLRKSKIITIGTELVNGQIFNSNAQWLATELTCIGFMNEEIISIPDNTSIIIEKLNQNIGKTDLLILTGGLGLTSDDLTKSTLSNYFKSPLVYIEDIAESLKIKLQQKAKIEFLPQNIGHAHLPKNCLIFNNPFGLAPAMGFLKDTTTIISLPGVPLELKSIFNTEIIPFLLNTFPSSFQIQNYNLLTAGMGETILAQKLSSFEKGLPVGMSLAYLPNFNCVKLRLTNTNPEYAAIYKEYCLQLKNELAFCLITDQNINLEQAIGSILTSKKLTICSAESCTGGFLSHLLSKYPDSSKFYIGSIISYSNQIKKHFLNVTDDIINNVGVVSPEAVKNMAEKIRQDFKTDYAISVSGLMGPGGASIYKPIGLVCLAISSSQSTQTYSFKTTYGRQENIEYTSQMALIKLWDKIKNENQLYVA